MDFIAIKCLCGRSRSTQCIGNINKTVVSPASPWVYEDPSTFFVLSQSVIGLSVFTIWVQIEFQSVIPTNNCHGVIDRAAPFVKILLSYNAGGGICISFSDSLQTYLGSTATDTYDTTGFERFVAVMVVQPAFYCVTSFFCTRVKWKITGRTQTIEHGSVPFLVAVHPSAVVLVGFTEAVDRTIRETAIYRHTWNTCCNGKLVFRRTIIWEWVHKVWRQTIVVRRCVCIAICIQLFRKHVSDTAWWTARTACLVEHRRKILRIGVVPILRKYCFSFEFSFVAVFHQRPVGLTNGIVVGISTYIHANTVSHNDIFVLCHDSRCSEWEQQTNHQEFWFHVCVIFI